MNLLLRNHQVPKITCPNHEDKIVEVINIDPQCKQKLCCYECVFEYAYQPQQILQIKEIFNSTHDQFINKWLRFEHPVNKEIFQTIFISNHEKSITSYLQDSLRQFKKSIDDYIDNLIEKMVDGFGQLEKQKSKLQTLFVNHEFQLLLRESLSAQNKERSKLEEEVSELIVKLEVENKRFESEVQSYAKSCQLEINKQQDILLSFPSQLAQFVQKSDLFKCDVPQEIEQNFNDFQVILGMQKLSVDMIKKSNYTVCYGDLTLALNKYKEIEILNEKDWNCQCYLDLNLQNNQKYEILLECSRSQAEQTIYIGMCPLSVINTVYLYNYNSHIPIVYSPSSLNLKVEKGIQITNDNSCNYQIKLQICLNDRIFKWKFGENNINSIKDWSTLKLNEPHFLAFQMYYANSQVIIKHIKQVYQFEEW